MSTAQDPTPLDVAEAQRCAALAVFARTVLALAAAAVLEHHPTATHLTVHIDHVGDYHSVGDVLDATGAVLEAAAGSLAAASETVTIDGIARRFTRTLDGLLYRALVDFDDPKEDLGLHPVGEGLYRLDLQVTR